MNSVLKHIACNQDMVGRYVFLPGAPERVPIIASYLEDAEKVAQNREHTTWTGYLEGEKVSVTSTGMGGPSSAICMEELVKCNAHTFIRIGGGAAIIDMQLGDLVIPTGAVKMEGTSRYYLPVEYPAVPDFSLVKALDDAAGRLGIKCYKGISVTKDSFFAQTEPDRMPMANELSKMWKQYELGGAINTSMEEAALFTVASVLRVRCASIHFCGSTQRKYQNAKAFHLQDHEQIQVNAIKVGIEAMRDIIIHDRSKNWKGV